MHQIWDTAQLVLASKLLLEVSVSSLTDQRGKNSVSGTAPVGHVRVGLQIPMEES